ncbi:MAG: CinA family protein [Chloroflexota bacterium]|nr:CinA family protein [Chloroflexota bacterium]
MKHCIKNKPYIMIASLLQERDWSLAVAESCTGGLLGDRITNVPGASNYFEGGIVAYSYEAKVQLLDVKWPTLEKYGAVSKEVALEMVRGVRQAFSTDVSISITGIAGPSGGTPEKPVGLTWIGLSTPDHEDVRKFVWDGKRLQNKEYSIQAALHILINFLTKT